MIKGSPRAQKVIGVLDIGSSKIAAAVVVPTAHDQGGSGFRVAGLGLQKSKGVKAGVLVDLDDAETAVRAAIGQAERAAGVTIEAVTVSIACGRLKSQHFAANADTDTGVVADEDLQRVTAAGRVYAERDGRSLIHMNRLAYQIDGASHVADPRGLSSRKVTAHFHAVTADEPPVRNLLLLVERCYLACNGLVASPYASALAVTSQEERDTGVTCIDLGAGTTAIAQFADGKLLNTDVIPVGSQHLTFDVAKALQAPLVEAERIKTLYGAVVTAQSDEHETFSYTYAGQDSAETYYSNKAELSAVIRPRAQQIVELVRERMNASAATAYAGGRLVLTGGASQLIGIGDYVSTVFGRPVRTAHPAHVAGLGQSVSGPQFSTLAGLAAAAASSDGDIGIDYGASQPDHGYLDRVGRWLKAGF